MSAAERVAHAAETIRARWEQRVASDPQTEAAQALEDSCQLLDPEVAAELEQFRALELGNLAGRVSATCTNPEHPTWLRVKADGRGCPWCRVAELEAERHTTNEALSDAAEQLRADRDRIAALEQQPAAKDRPVDEDPIAYALTGKVDASADKLTRLFAPTQALREPLEDPHDGPLHHDYRVGRDLPETGRCPVTAGSQFAAWLKAARAGAELSQQKVSDVLRGQGFTALHQTVIAKIERCERPVRLDEAVAMVELFGTTLDVALGLTQGSPDSLAGRRAASQLVLLQQIRASIDAELGGAR